MAQLDALLAGQSELLASRRGSKAPTSETAISLAVASCRDSNTRSVRIRGGMAFGSVGDDNNDTALKVLLPFYFLALLLSSLVCFRSARVVTVASSHFLAAS